MHPATSLSLWVGSFMWVGGIGIRILILWLCPYMSTCVLIQYVGSDLSHIAATEVPIVGATRALRHERTYELQRARLKASRMEQCWQALEKVLVHVSMYMYGRLALHLTLVKNHLSTYDETSSWESQTKPSFCGSEIPLDYQGDQLLSGLSYSGFKTVSATLDIKMLRDQSHIFRSIPGKVEPNPDSVLLLRVPNITLWDVQ